MTDPTPTTDEEIALRLGWRKVSQQLIGNKVVGSKLGAWKAPDGTFHEEVPDFEHDGALAMSLLDKMRSELGWTSTGLRLSAVWEEDMNLIGAIACAWLVWKKEEQSSEPSPDKT